MKITIKNYLEKHPETQLYVGNPIYRLLDMLVGEDDKELLMNLEISDEQHFIWSSNKNPDNTINVERGTRIIIITRLQYNRTLFEHNNSLEPVHFPPEERNCQLRLINGKPSTKTPIGYCHSTVHPGYLSKSLIESHKCIGNQCHYFQRYESQPFWSDYNKELELKKQRKKERKLALENLSIPSKK